MQRYGQFWEILPFKMHSKWAGNSLKFPLCLKTKGISDAVKKTKSFDKTRMTSDWLCKNLVAMKTTHRSRHRSFPNARFFGSLFPKRTLNGQMWVVFETTKTSGKV